MADGNAARIAAFLAEEYRAAGAATRANRIDEAWHHLERAHIVAQNQIWQHCHSHWKMLVLASSVRNWREVGAQVTRLVLAPLGKLTGRLPVGNTGRGNVSAFARMRIPPDLQAILDPAGD